MKTATHELSAQELSKISKTLEGYKYLDHELVPAAQALLAERRFSSPLKERELANIRKTLSGYTHLARNGDELARAAFALLDSRPQ